MDYLTTLISLSPIRRGFMPGFVNYKKGALDSQLQVIKFTSCLPTVGGSLRVLRLPQPLKLIRHGIAEMLLKSGVKQQSLAHSYNYRIISCTIFPVQYLVNVVHIIVSIQS